MFGCGFFHKPWLNQFCYSLLCEHHPKIGGIECFLNFFTPLLTFSLEVGDSPQSGEEISRFNRGTKLTFGILQSLKERVAWSRRWRS